MERVRGNLGSLIFCRKRNCRFDSCIRHQSMRLANKNLKKKEGSRVSNNAKIACVCQNASRITNLSPWEGNNMERTIEMYGGKVYGVEVSEYGLKRGYLNTKKGE